VITPSSSYTTTLDGSTHDVIAEVVERLGSVLLGKEHQIKLALACMFARGHLLIEDLPGMGKTMLSHALARVLGLSFNRIQFTSDVLPGDIVGVSVFDREQNAFRFVVEGEGVWTVVNRDPVPMRRGDFLPQAGLNWHAHHNAADEPMAWIDGLDIPFQHGIEAQFFDFGRDELSAGEHATPDRSRSERLWANPGLVPVARFERTAGSPLLRYRWEDTDAALTDQLDLERAGHPATVEPGHAVVRYTNPTTGRDALPTIRTQFHRIRSGAQTAPRRETGSSVYQVFDGSGRVGVGGYSWSVQRGDLFVVPSWTPLSIGSEASASDSDSGALDLFQFSDAPVFAKLNLFRSQVDGDHGEARDNPAR